MAAVMPSEVSGKPSLFDRFATAIAEFVSKAWFFSLCVLLIVLWAPSILMMPDLNTWQLAVNTPTTIVTFLLVALLQNTQKRANDASQQKANATAAGIAALLEPELDADTRARVRRELSDAVGLEMQENT